MQDDLKEIYLDWISSTIGNVYDGRSYNKLIFLLNEIEFTYLRPLDENRAADGINFRYRFGYENGYSRDFIRNYLDDHPCSVLEMMAALAFRCEESIMSNLESGDRTGVWFWEMISSLGLLDMDDDNFDEKIIYNSIKRMLARSYKKNGRGGLFMTHNPNIDMRKLDIWYQLMVFLNEFDT